MSDNIPFDIQTEIMRRLPTKSLLRFRCVSKQWKSLIDSPEFIKNHCRTINTHQHQLLVLQNPTNTYLSIIDNDVIPNEKSSYTIPPLLKSFMNRDNFTCVNGLLCFRGYAWRSYFAVLWNPSVGKFVAIKIPNILNLKVTEFIGFGYCPDTFDPKLVRIIKANYDTHKWNVDVFKLSSRAWKRLYTGHKAVCDLKQYHVCIKGYIYWQASDYSSRDYPNVITSFDLKTEMFGKVCLPDRLKPTHNWRVVELNESLGVLEDDSDGGCGVWILDFVTKSFTKMFTVKIPHQCQFLYNGVLGFRKNGEVIIKVKDYNMYGLAAYEPSSRRIKQEYCNYYGKYGTLINVLPYMESLLLLDQTSSVIP